MTIKFGWQHQKQTKITYYFVLAQNTAHIEQSTSITLAAPALY